jgi:predicted metal-dependent hydrolase
VFLWRGWYGPVYDADVGWAASVATCTHVELALWTRKKSALVVRAVGSRGLRVVANRRYGARVAGFDIPAESSAASARRALPEAAALRAATKIEVRRSARRRRTVSAYREGDTTIVLLPARMSRAEEERWIDVMLERLAKQERRSAGRAARGDAELGRRAAELSRRFLGGVPQPASVRWVSNQGSRWGSCTPVDGTIRLSDRLASTPGWVIDYVLVHELAHLIEIGHGPRFHRLVDAYPKAERARGYLLGVVAGAGWAPEPELAAGPDDEQHSGALW